MRAAFRILDVDGDGTISLQELGSVMQGSKEELLSTMQLADLNGDGVIDFAEFKAMITALAPGPSKIPSLGAKQLHIPQLDMNKRQGSGVESSQPSARTASTRATPRTDIISDSELE
jgi:hypothetical protein